MINNKTLYSSLFWVSTVIALTVVFGASDGDYIQSFFFISFLLPVVMGTSYVFNEFLVPKYLLKEQYWLFALYVLYLIVFSLYLELIVIFISLILLADYQYQQLNPLSTNLFLLTVLLYLIVFVQSFFRLISKYKRQSTDLAEIQHDQIKNQQKSLIVKADRKRIKIDMKDLLFIESLADYCKLHTVHDQVITKEKISGFEEKLPDHFIRTHRSYIVNSEKINSYNSDSVLIDTIEIPISRTYKKTVRNLLEANEK